MQEKRLNKLQRIMFRLSKKKILENGAFYRYYVYHIKRKPVILKVNLHSRNPDISIITVKDYLSRFYRKYDFEDAKMELRSLGFDI